ncbi:DUF3396 domain-containing protein [Corallococcus sp. AB049A]|uniref:DUF3396 domain-containing protein n=1 Tax=Corallococcus interemptor TaxID=2316720 RepID=A0A3A8QSP5_9BACT|nr:MULTISPECIES: type VI immunity family protein [Corallococcus]RKH71716.1 DUF3396 domain-containing protein [Corallococcus interemptor]RKI73853.1 DUF3396 domain-containing protein [Corallococcus sp. AB049A]
MATSYPESRVTLDIEGEPIVVLREAVSIAFFMGGPHEELALPLCRALERYRRAIEPRSLAWYVDRHGDWSPLAEEADAFLTEAVMHPATGRIEVSEKPDSVTGIRFKYRGRGLPQQPFFQLTPHGTFAAEFWLPIEFLEHPGPEWVRALALELGRELPFHSGYVGLSFDAWGWAESTTPVMKAKGFRHPGLLLPGLETLATKLGTRLWGPTWLNFLGPPVLNELGGVEGLRSRLHSPSTQVEALSPDRAVVSLGPVPEAGDVEAGDTLPAYRELARLLEPWLYAHQGAWGGLTEAEVRQWERRFL